MSISDWSSDVCSSDLLEGFVEWRYTARADVDRATAVVFTVTGRCVDHQDFIDRDAARELVADQCSLEFDTAKRRDQQQFDAIDRSRVVHRAPRQRRAGHRSEEHTSELQSLMRISYAVFCLKKKKHPDHHTHN